MRHYSVVGDFSIASNYTKNSFYKSLHNIKRVPNKGGSCYHNFFLHKSGRLLAWVNR